MAAEGLEGIAEREYPGRLIIVGRDVPGRHDIIAYAITGRSASSRARRLVEEKGTVRIEVTDSAVLKQGNPKLLVYNCIRRHEDIFIVSNGAQTDLIYETLNRRIDYSTAGSLLCVAFSKPHEVGGVDVTTYEPDEPNFTPRITGIVAKNSAVLGIVRREDHGRIRCCYEFRQSAGRACAIMTYAGNAPPGKPLPSFKDSHLEVRLLGRTPEEVAQDLYGALAPQSGDDLRVAAAAMFYDRETGDVKTSIVNRHNL